MAETDETIESRRLLDDAGYGKEVPNSMSEMIKKALSENTALREQLARITQQRDAYRQALEAEYKS